MQTRYEFIESIASRKKTNIETYERKEWTQQKKTNNDSPADRMNANKDIAASTAIVYVMRQRIEKANDWRKSWSLERQSTATNEILLFYSSCNSKMAIFMKTGNGYEFKQIAIPMKCISHVCIAASKYFTGNQRMIAISTVISYVSQLKIIQYWLNEVKPINWPCHLRLFQP